MKGLRVFLLSLILTSCVSSKKAVYNDGFSDSWWQEIAKDQAAGWEVLPQAADRSQKEVILSKRTELGAFSNLQPAPFTLDGEKYASVEALWQAMKYPEGPKDERLKNKSVEWKLTREQVKKMSGFESKAAGDAANENMKKLGIKWVTYKGKKIEYKGKDQQAHYDIILMASRQKIVENPPLKELLLRTKNLKLKPDHQISGDSPPAYNYPEIYMKIREEFTEELSQK